MLSEEEIRQTLHADRVVHLPVENPHGPFGLEQLAEAVSRVNPAVPSSAESVQRPISLDNETWQKLDQLAQSAAKDVSNSVTATQVAETIIRQYVTRLLEMPGSSE